MDEKSSNSSASAADCLEDDSTVGAVVYQKQGGASKDCDLWDDSALIRAYDKAVNLTYDAVLNEETKNLANSSSGRKKKRKPRSKKGLKGWKVGDVCLALYDEDECYYEAAIEALDPTNATARIRYVQYDEEETRPISLLRHPESLAESSTAESGREDQNMRQDGLHYGGQTGIRLNGPMPRLAPPPPPRWMSASSRPDDDDALSSMLLSWYMSGYHTGYYQALRDIQTGAHTNKN